MSPVRSSLGNSGLPALLDLAAEDRPIPRAVWVLFAVGVVRAWDGLSAGLT